MTKATSAHLVAFAQVSLGEPVPEKKD